MRRTELDRGADPQERFDHALVRRHQQIRQSIRQWRFHEIPRRSVQDDRRKGNIGRILTQMRRRIETPIRHQQAGQSKGHDWLWYAEKRGQ